MNAASVPYIVVDTKSQQFMARWLAPRTHQVLHNNERISVPFGLTYTAWLRKICAIFCTPSSGPPKRTIYHLLIPEKSFQWSTAKPMGTITIPMETGFLTIEPFDPNELKAEIAGNGSKKVVIMIPDELSLEQWLAEIAETIVGITTRLHVRAADTPTMASINNTSHRWMIRKLVSDIYVENPVLLMVTSEMKLHSAEIVIDDPDFSGIQRHSELKLWSPLSKDLRAATVFDSPTRRVIIYVGGMLVGLLIRSNQSLQEYVAEALGSIKDDEILYLELSDIQLKNESCVEVSADLECVDGTVIIN